MPRPDHGEPTASPGQLSTRCKILATQLASLLELSSGGIVLAVFSSDEGAVVELAGRDSEFVARNFGNPHRVVPLCPLSDGIGAWAGYREAWRREGTERKYRYVEAGFTIHLGRAGEIDKPQIMRNEWVGPRSRSFVRDAGHPHWQLDVLETSRLHAGNREPSFGRPPPSPETFVTPRQDPIDVLRRLTLERMHLASAALWWRGPAQPVAHVPASLAELDQWVLGCVSYMRQELMRCGLSNDRLP